MENKLIKACVLLVMCALLGCISNKENQKITHLMKDAKDAIENQSIIDFQSLTEYGYKLKKRDKMGKIFDAKLKYEWERIYNFMGRAERIKVIKSESKSNNEDSFELYILVNGTNYYILDFLIKKVEKNIFLSKLKVRDLSWECHEFQTVGYDPKDIILEQANWKSNLEGSFQHFTLKVINNTVRKVDSIEYSLILRKENGQVFFQDIMSHSLGIKAGYAINIPVYELYDKDFNFKIQEDNFISKIMILNYYPQPNEDSCDVISSLQN